MTYALRYRPKTFDEVVGNEGTITAIRTLLSRKKGVPRSWLLTGLSGGGKTTIARLIGESIGARGMGLVEHNAANFTSIEDMRKIVDMIKVRPIGSDYILIILDECHQLSKSSQNLLLKELEDTPKYAYFVLCTTEPDKLLETLRNRCMPFEVQPLRDGLMAGLLDKVIATEGIAVSDKVKEHIIGSASGSARNALTMLESAATNPDEDTAIEVVSKMAKKEALATERAIANKLIDLMSVDAPLAKAWPPIAQFIKSEIFAPRRNLAEVKFSLAQVLSEDLCQGYDLRIARAILLFDREYSIYHQSHFVALVALALREFQNESTTE